MYGEHTQPTQITLSRKSELPVQRAAHNRADHNAIKRHKKTV
jgi:hypothetical protein